MKSEQATTSTEAIDFQLLPGGGYSLTLPASSGIAKILLPAVAFKQIAQKPQYLLRKAATTSFGMLSNFVSLLLPISWRELEKKDKSQTCPNLRACENKKTKALSVSQYQITYSAKKQK